MLIILFDLICLFRDTVIIKRSYYTAMASEGHSDPYKNIPNKRYSEMTNEDVKKLTTFMAKCEKAIKAHTAQLELVTKLIVDLKASLVADGRRPNLVPASYHMVPDFIKVNSNTTACDQIVADFERAKINNDETQKQSTPASTSGIITPQSSPII